MIVVNPIRTGILLSWLALAACRTSASPAPSPSASVKAAVRIEPSRTAAKTFGEPCVTDAECAAAVCFHKRLKGPDSGAERRDAQSEPVEQDGYCSMSCNTDADCPVPPTRGKCGARGMCKRPE